MDAQVSIYQRTPCEAAASVFGVDRAVVRLKGHPEGPDFTVEGSSKAAPDMHFEARMTKLEDPRWLISTAQWEARRTINDVA